MFSDFKMHVAGVPQIAPFFGLAEGNVIFDGPGEDEDFGLEQITGNSADRYMFRTSPLRNLALQAAFFHNGSFTRLRDALRFHLDPLSYARDYDPSKEAVDRDLSHRLGPIEPVLERLDPLLRDVSLLDPKEFDDLLAFLEEALLDPRARAERLCRLPPDSVPSGLPLIHFEGCRSSSTDTP